MKPGIKSIIAFVIALAVLTVIQLNVTRVIANTTVVQCECGNSQCSGCSLGSRILGKLDCHRCGRDCAGTQCPSCECKICQLELDHTPVKKTCFKVEQKTICIPPVRLPWRKNCPPGTSRTKTVNVLKTHSYECPNCSYKWSLVQPQVAVIPITSDQPLSSVPTPIPAQVKTLPVTNFQAPILPTDSSQK